MKKLLVVVDYQNDFVCGALGFDGAEKLEPGILQAVEQTLAEGGYVLFTRDTHQDDYLATREGGYLPVPHCIKGTEGHALYGRLHRYETESVANTRVVDKPTFGSATLAAEAEALCGGVPEAITLCGLVTDICVIANAIMLHTMFPLAKIQVNAALSGTGNQQGGESALAVLRGMGVEIL